METLNDENKIQVNEKNKKLKSIKKIIENKQFYKFLYYWS